MTQLLVEAKRFESAWHKKGQVENLSFISLTIPSLSIRFHQRLEFICFFFSFSSFFLFFSSVLVIMLFAM